MLTVTKDNKFEKMPDGCQCQLGQHKDPYGPYLMRTGSSTKAYKGICRLVTANSTNKTKLIVTNDWATRSTENLPGGCQINVTLVILRKRNKFENRSVLESNQHLLLARLF